MRSRSLPLRSLLVSALLVLAPLGPLGARPPDDLRAPLVKAVAETLWRSVEVSLQEAGHAELAAWVRAQPPPTALSGATLAQLSASLGRRLLAAHAASGRAGERKGLQAALARAAGYLGLDGRLLEQPLLLARSPARRLAEPPPPLTHEVEDLTSCVQEVCWPGIGPYTEDRLGPMREVLLRLRPGDRVVLTNVRDSILDELPDLASATRYHVPLSSYGKQLTLATQSGGTRTFVVSGFDSRAYLLHVGLLVSRFRHARRLQFEIAERVDPERLERSYGQLAAFAAAHPALFSSLDSLVVGYADDVRRAWKPYLVGEARQQGHRSENWELSAYRFPEGATVGVLAGDVDYYGEGLAEQLERLLAHAPLKRIFFGGSGGALVPRPPYDMYFPSSVRSDDGFEVDNVLTGSSDAGAHVSVDSPLLESPVRLAALARLGCCTVDMEAGHLARLAARHGLELGVGILVTDFPVGFKSIGASLARQDFHAKTEARVSFARTVEAYVRRGRRTWLHFLERLNDSPLLELSRTNLRRHRAEVGAFTAEEQDVVERLFSLPFRVTIRMSPGRLHWLLTDGALFSTGLVNSLGTQTSPFTPQLEDEMFGAFDYVFAEYSTATGHSRYGDVAVLLKPEVSLPRSWGSRASGWRVAGYERGATLEVHQRNFLAEVLHPDHYREAMALQAVYRWRRLTPAEHALLLSHPTRDWPPLLYELGFGKLELKLKSHVMLREVERVLLPPEAAGELPDLLRARALPFEYYDPRS